MSCTSDCTVAIATAGLAAWLVACCMHCFADLAFGVASLVGAWLRVATSASAFAGVIAIDSLGTAEAPIARTTMVVFDSYFRFSVVASSTTAAEPEHAATGSLSYFHFPFLKSY